MSMRNFNIVLVTTTKSSNRLRHVLTVRSTCSQTETSSLSMLNVSVARVFFKPSVFGKEASESMNAYWNPSAPSTHTFPNQRRQFWLI